MEKINFEDLPSTDTPIDSTNLNLLQTNVENAINDLPQKIFPVGSIYISVTNTNPSSFLGGTWVSFGQGRTLVGVDTTQTEFNTVLKSGGAKTHTLTTAQMPAHTHNSPNGGNFVEDGGSGIAIHTQAGGAFATKTTKTEVANTGGGQAHNNLQPYITVYFWRRTA